MIIHNIKNRMTSGYTTFGSTWGKGEVKGDGFVLSNEQGEEIPVQSRIMAWWPDGSIKWASHTADSGQMGKSAAINPADGKEHVVNTQSITIKVEKKDEGFFVDTGKITFHIMRKMI